MPADRRITINVTSEGHRNDFGEWVEGEVTPIGMWASRRDKSLTDIATEGGTRDQARRTWRIRWDSRIASSPTSLLEVEDGAICFSIANMVEVTQRRGAPDLRRRFLDLEGLHET